MTTNIGARGIYSQKMDDIKKVVTIPAGQGKAMAFPVIPVSLGNIPLVVQAQSYAAADAVRRNLLVEVRQNDINPSNSSSTVPFEKGYFSGGGGGGGSHKNDWKHKTAPWSGKKTLQSKRCNFLMNRKWQIPTGKQSLESLLME